MNKQQVIERLCKLASKVNEEVYGWSIASDCLCREGVDENLRFDEDVITFIEQAVMESIVRTQDAESEMED
ncbi:hypothetical protein NVP1193O_114 [Vibrio phage 1.193.O._10N.286.52.C6]|nr:hypothetical protein NVP1193O_114 [Vibrio phage 1.193.O._10N.286.52.C6]